MMIRKCLLNGTAMFLVLGILSLSLLTVIPVQDVHAWGNWKCLGAKTLCRLVQAGAVLTCAAEPILCLVAQDWARDVCDWADSV